MHDTVRVVVKALTQQFQAFLENQKNQPQYDSGDEGLGGDDSREVPRPRCRPPVHFEENKRQDDKKVWELGMRIEVLEFQGGLQPKEFIDWLCTIEEVMEFKGVPEEMKVPLIATRLQSKAAAWW